MKISTVWGLLVLMVGLASCTAEVVATSAAGSDTWIPSRWERYQDIIEFDRGWLSQLPPEVAQQIAYNNAVRLFGAGPHLWNHRGIE